MPFHSINPDKPLGLRYDTCPQGLTNTVRLTLVNTHTHTEFKILKYTAQELKKLDKNSINFCKQWCKWIMHNHNKPLERREYCTEIGWAASTSKPLNSHSSKTPVFTRQHAVIALHTCIFINTAVTTANLTPQHHCTGECSLDLPSSVFYKLERKY
jgi:hypothetical protein